MSHVVSTSLARQLGVLFDSGSLAGLSDRQLLERFTARTEPVGEAAFAAIVARHGPMVLSVCRQILGDHHHAEDAFQAVFFVLARRARSIRDPDLLGTWLYGVTLRTARKARGRLARRRRTDEEGSTRHEASAAMPAGQALIDYEQAKALHHEIDRLPDAFRAPIVLCYFEGLTLDEAARSLHCPAGTLRSRLARAREKLRRALTRRGVVLSAAALGAAFDPRPASASVSSLLCDSTTKAAIAFAANHAAASGAISAPATAIAREVLRTMLVQKLKAAALSLVLLVTVASGALSAFAHSREGEPPGEPIAQQARTEPRPPKSPRPPDATRPAAGRMSVVGRVLDPAGKPVPNATTMAYASTKWPGRGDRLAPLWPSAIGQARSDGSGRFRLDAPRISSARHYEFGAIAVAPGYGAGWVTLDPDADQPTAEIALRPEQVIQGRIFDVQGRPVGGVVVSVENMGTIVTGDPTMRLREFEGPFFLPDQPDRLPAWPHPATTDANGRFTIHGVGRGLRLRLAVDDRRFAKLGVDVATDATSEIKTVTMAVEPARIITGRVTDAETGRPLPHAVIDISVTRDNGSAWAGDCETDGQGSFRANPGAAQGYLIFAMSPERTPYLDVFKRLEWPKGAIEQTVDLALPRGVLVRGKVVEEKSDKPIAGARIGYHSHPNSDERAGALNARAATDADGSFAFGVIPAPGYITVLGPGEDYVLNVLGSHQAYAGQAGGRRLYAHAFHKLDLKPGSGSQEVDVTITLRPGAAVQGQVVGPDGRPIPEAAIFSRVVLQPGWVSFLVWSPFFRGAVRNGHFAVHGLADDQEVPVYFLDAQHNLGATAQLSGQSAANGPVTVRLEPCGSARARLVDPKGQPVARSRDGYNSHATAMVVTPGPHRGSQGEADRGQLAGDLDFLARFDPVHYPNGLVSDDKGVLHLQALIPGATYRIYDGTASESAGPRLRKEFTVKPGESLDLGDILIAK